MRRTFIVTGRLAALAGLLALAGSACADASGPDGSGDGFVQGVVHDNPTSTSPSRAGPVFHVAGSSEQSSYSGTISGDMSVAISADGKVWYELGSPNGVTVQAQSTGSGTNVHGEVTVPAGTYSRVRLVMRNATATVKAGAQIGGVTFEADVDVVMGGGGEIVIEKKVSTFTVSATASSRLEILFDLNSEVWLNRENVEDGEAPKEEIEDAPEADTRESPRGDTTQ